MWHKKGDNEQVKNRNASHAKSGMTWIIYCILLSSVAIVRHQYG